MKEFTLFDPLGLKEAKAVETTDFVVLVEENIAIRKDDFFRYEDEIFYDRKFPVFVSIPPKVYENYVNKGEYSPNRYNVLKTILNGKLKFVVQDKYKDDKFLYDTFLNPIFRPFAVELLSSSWDLSAINKKLHRNSNISGLKVSDYSAAEGLQKLSFLYRPKSESEFTTIYYKCLQAGVTGYPVTAHIIDELDLAYFQKKEE